MTRILFTLSFFAAFGLGGGPQQHWHAYAAANSYFKITVVDAQTGRGVPLVELKTVNNAAWWTDSNGVVAFDEPGLMGLETYFHVSSPGYDYAKDFFGNRGVKLKPVADSSAQIKLTRTNIAERLYRMTGQGIFRDSVLVGGRVPLKHSVLNGQVMGQDTVIATPYRGKIYWFWGDTERVAYPLGNFAASGATSEWPGRGGLDPSVGVDLNYFVDPTGFSKAMCPDFGPGLHWIEGVMTVPDTNGAERLVARVSSQMGLAPAYAWHLAVFNDQKQIFESRVRWEITESHDSSHPFRARVNGVEYLFLYPNYRVKANLQSLSDLKNYEAFTCVAGGGKVREAESEVDRDASGKVRYSWKAGADRLHGGRLRQLIAAGKLQPGESWVQLHDIETGAPLEAGRGSVFWNDCRGRWVRIVSGKPGEIWFGEADTPVGPWAYARRVVTHGRYNFYNPTQHPFFDQEGGRLIYFEGTYTASFSDAPAKTPRYDYNQIMYRLALDDPRLSLPAPVYRMKDQQNLPRYLLREGIETEKALDQIEEIAFFAIPPARKPDGLVPIFESGAGIESRLRTNAPGLTKQALFFALPASATRPSSTARGDQASAVVPLYEYRSATDGRCFYSTQADFSDPTFRRSAEPLCRVWKNPVKTLALDFQAQPVRERIQ